MCIRIPDKDHHQNLIVCSLAHCQPSLKISYKSVWKFLHTVANKQTDNDKNNLLGRGNNNENNADTLDFLPKLQPVPNVETLRIIGQSFAGQKPFVSPTQWCQNSTEGNSKHWRQPPILTTVEHNTDHCWPQPTLTTVDHNTHHCRPQPTLTTLDHHTDHCWPSYWPLFTTTLTTVDYHTDHCWPQPTMTTVDHHTDHCWPQHWPLLTTTNTDHWWPQHWPLLTTTLRTTDHHTDHCWRTLTTVDHHTDHCWPQPTLTTVDQHNDHCWPAQGPASELIRCFQQPAAAKNTETLSKWL